ncbi:hypothetical protein [Nocardioides sp. GY 10127]|uniref:hypothetical protein n=1 Tax=Nocardioides sp. GY 10127 TaxID=2569762 RepID=UPI0010A83FF2|nr:hypothetical protein [Nocardioides sp. GY 10127]TIC80165.1 hypothetical protein E8D37_16365 [Nocardioides sp. GY 10127]
MDAPDDASRDPFPPAATGAGGPAWAVGSIVAGLLGVLLSWTGVPGLVLGLVAIGLGGTGTWRSGRGLATGRLGAIVGWVLGLIATAVAGGALLLDAWLRWQITR